MYVLIVITGYANNESDQGHRIWSQVFDTQDAAENVATWIRHRAEDARVNVFPVTL